MFRKELIKIVLTLSCPGDCLRGVKSSGVVQCKITEDVHLDRTALISGTRLRTVTKGRNQWIVARHVTKTQTHVRVNDS